jgi:nitrite reductase/ring-hydroxylating ferredoxin subunit
VNPAQPQAGARLCALADIPEPGSKGFMFREGEKLFFGFVVRRAGEVSGYIDRCPHTGLPLALAPDRFLTRENDLILCSSHGALFRIVDGVCIAGPCAGQRLWPWPVKVEGDHILAA